jgi:anti-sigma factor RsiW
MNAHLTEAQIYDLLDLSSPARPDDAASRHLDTCPRCRAEFDALRDSLSNFRLAATNISLTHVPFRRAVVETPSSPSFVNRSRILWASGFATAMLAVAIVIPAVRNVPTTPKSPVVAANTTMLEAESDEALLRDIDRDLSTSVPTPLEPLTGTSSSGSTSTSNPN